MPRLYLANLPWKPFISFFLFPPPTPPPILQLSYSGSFRNRRWENCIGFVFVAVVLFYFVWGGGWRVGKEGRGRTEEWWRGRKGNTSVFTKQAHIRELLVSRASKGQMLLTVGELKYGGGSLSPEAEKLLYEAGRMGLTHLAWVPVRVQMEREGQAGGEAPAAAELTHRPCLAAQPRFPQPQRRQQLTGKHPEHK